MSKFHRFHGSNIILFDDNTVAQRRSSYANGLTFSERPLKPGEIFLLEIERTERGWTGDLRVGLTQLNPYEAQIQGLRLPQYALPDLTTMKSSWIYAVSKSRPAHPNPNHTERTRIETSHRSVLCSDFQPCKADLNVRILPTDVGSRIGIFYMPGLHEHRRVAELHFIVNGEDQGPFATDIPFNDRPLYVVIDVYGCTKQVRILQVKYDVASLQSICRGAILSNVNGSAITHLPLPRVMKEYLLERFWN